LNCLVTVSHFVTLTEDSAAAGSQFHNCSTETGRKILYHGEEHGEFCLHIYTKEQDFFSKYKEKKLNT